MEDDVDAILVGLVALACPVGMGLMMWFMARGNRQRPPERETEEEYRAEKQSLDVELERVGQAASGEPLSGERDRILRVTSERDRTVR